MILSDIAKTAQRYTIDNSPSLLTGVGIAGTIMTAILTARATKQAVRRLDREMPDELDLKRTVELTWTYYIPPFVAGGVTIASIVAANQISSRRAAALAAAFSLSEKLADEYREKVEETIGKKKEEGIRAAVAQDRMDASANSEVVITDNGDVLCYDTLTGRYFNSTMEKIRAAVNDVNATINKDDYCGLSSFYDWLGLQPTAFSEEVGWNQDYKCQVRFSTVMSEDNKPALAIQYQIQPVRNYFRSY